MPHRFLIDTTKQDPEDDSQIVLVGEKTTTTYKVLRTVNGPMLAIESKVPNAA